MNFHTSNRRQKLVTTLCVILMSGIILSAFPLMCAVKVSGAKAEKLGLPVSGQQNNPGTGSENEANAEFVTLLIHDTFHAVIKNKMRLLVASTSRFLLPKVAIAINLPPPKT